MPSTSVPSIWLAEFPEEVRALITHGLFYGALGVLTSVAMYHPDLDFATICSGYADSCSMEDIQSLGESLLPHAKLLAEQVSALWVMDARRADMARSMRQEDIAQPLDGVEPMLELDIASPPTEPNVAQWRTSSPFPRWSSR